MTLADHHIDIEGREHGGQGGGLLFDFALGSLVELGERHGKLLGIVHPFEAHILPDHGHQLNFQGPTLGVIHRKNRSGLHRETRK